MVRYEDSPGVDKHLRFGNYTEELHHVLVGFPGIKAIVLHTHGAKGEHPHIHVWYTAEKAVTNQTVRNRLKAYNDLFKLCKSQNDWSFRNHDSWETWKSYVCNNPSHKVLLDYQDLKTHSERQSLIIASTPRTPAELNAPGPRVIEVKKKRLTDTDRLIAYCENELKWRRDEQWSLDSYETCKMEVRKHMVTVLRSKFNDPRGVVVARNCMWEFADEGLKDVLWRIFTDGVAKYL